METIIGLGSAGCNIAEKFAQYPQYNILRIDTEKRKGEDFKLIPKQDSHEAYEMNCPSFKKLFEDVTEDCLVIVGGSGKVSGLLLRMLEQLSHRKVGISVLYIQPDVEALPRMAKMQEKVVFQILQQYARSAMFKRLYLVSNPSIEDILGELPIRGYFDKINEFLTSTIHMINIFDNSEPLMSTFETPTESARISTFGILDIENNEEKLFYPLIFPRERLYYYAIGNERLESERGLYKKILSFVKGRTDGNKVRSSYSIYPTDYSDDYVYSTTHSSLIQGEKNGDSL